MGASVDHVPRAETFCADGRRTSVEHEFRPKKETIAQQAETNDLIFTAASIRSFRSQIVKLDYLAAKRIVVKQTIVIRANRGSSPGFAPPRIDGCQNVWMPVLTGMTA